MPDGAFRPAYNVQYAGDTESQIIVDVEVVTSGSGDSPAVGDWRKRMAGAEAKELYKQRASTAECVNAQARNRRLTRLRVRVRGIRKVKAVAVLFALAHNLLRAATLAPELVGLGTGTSAVAQVPGQGVEKPQNQGTKAERRVGSFAFYATAELFPSARHRRPLPRWQC